MNRRRGIFITFEGTEGAGKSTQLSMLYQALVKRGFNCLLTREPGGTPLAEQLRNIVKYHNTDEAIASETELLLFAASRAQHVNNLIKPALAAGKIVLCDRFYDSTLAYQGYARQLNIDFVKRLNRFAAAGCQPDLTILLDLPPETGFLRTATRVETGSASDRMEMEELGFYHTVRDAFLAIAEQEPQRVKVIAANADKEMIHQQIMELVNEII